MFTNEERLRYYLGKFYKQKVQIELASIPNRAAYKYNPLSPLDHDNSIMLLKHHSPYLLDKLNKALFFEGLTDIGYALPKFSEPVLKDIITKLPLLSSCRPIGNDSVILLKTHVKAKWNHFTENQPFLSMPLKERKARVVWNGTKGERKITKSGLSRKMFVTKYADYDAEKYDIGYRRDSMYTKACNRYLVVLQGNDVSDGTSRALNSGSVPMIANLDNEHWLMEGLLKPWVHYIPIVNENNEYDLEEKFNWCEKNFDKCLEIVNNCKKYMQMFNDFDNELKLHNALIEHYNEYVTLV